MIRIVHIARSVGGIGVYINLLVKHIDESCFENIVICNQKEKVVKIQDSSNVKTPLFHVNLKREINIINDIACLKKIISLLKKIKPDIIHCHSAKAGFLGRMAGAYLKIPTAYTPHAYSYLSAETTFKRAVFKSVEKVFRYFPSTTIACSLSEYNRAINDLKIQKNKVFLWNNSIENNIVFKPSVVINKGYVLE